MNRRDIEEAIRISKELQNNRIMGEEIRNSKRIYDELSAHKNNLGIDKEIISLRNRDRELQNHRDEVRRIKDFQTSRHNLGIRPDLNFRNELLNSRRSLEKMLRPKDELIEKSLFGAKRNFKDAFETRQIRQNQNEIEQVKKDYLRSERDLGLIKNDYLKSINGIEQIKRDSLRNENELGRIRRDHLTSLPKWQEQILPALSMRRSEAQELLNNRIAIREKLNFIPNNFRKDEFWNEIDNLRNTYVGNLAISMRDAVETSLSNEEVIDKIESLYEEKVGLLPKNQLSREFVISLFLTILLTVIQLWYSYYLSEQSSVELNSLFAQTFQRLEKIENKLENSDPSKEVIEDSEIYYLVQRNVSVYNRPNFNSLTLDYLSPKTKVRLLKTKHKWIYIEYIDYLEVVPRYGWVNKKYLKRLEK